jgi:uncharacterized lipoprotein
MHQIIKCIGICFFVVSCGTSEDSRYRDTALLERPPTLIIPKTSGTTETTDESSIPKKPGPGLADQVYLTTSTPPQLKIKLSYEKAWDTLTRALKQSDIKITDQERNKGHLYVNYDSAGFFEKATSFLQDGHKDTIYFLLIEEGKDETTISVSIANTTEQTGSTVNTDSPDKKSLDASDELIQTLFKTIRDDVLEE